MRDADPDCVDSAGDSSAGLAGECGMEGIPQGEHGGVPRPAPHLGGGHRQHPRLAVRNIHQEWPGSGTLPRL